MSEHSFSAQSEQHQKLDFQMQLSLLSSQSVWVWPNFSNWKMTTRIVIQRSRARVSISQLTKWLYLQKAAHLFAIWFIPSCLSLKVHLFLFRTLFSCRSSKDSHFVFAAHFTSARNLLKTAARGSLLSSNAPQNFAKKYFLPATNWNKGGFVLDTCRLAAPF